MGALMWDDDDDDDDGGGGYGDDGSLPNNLSFFVFYILFYLRAGWKRQQHKRFKQGTRHFFLTRSTVTAWYTYKENLWYYLPDHF